MGPPVWVGASPPPLPPTEFDDRRDLIVVNKCATSSLPRQCAYSNLSPGEHDVDERGASQAERTPTQPPIGSITKRATVGGDMQNQ